MTNLFYLSSCSSTNDEIVPLLKMQQKLPIGVYTFHQTKGRGQYGNSWENSRNENLAITFAFKKRDISISSTLFNYYTAIVLRDFIANMSGVDVFVKWPNDIIITQKKVAGILIEKIKVNAESFFIVGIGVNVLQHHFDGRFTAGSILSQTGKEFDLHDFSTEMATYFYTRFQDNESGLNVVSYFNKFLFRKNSISVFELNGVRQNGIIQFADEEGYLTVELENDGIQRFSNKEIKLLY